MLEGNKYWVSLKVPRDPRNPLILLFQHSDSETSSCEAQCLCFREKLLSNGKHGMKIKMHLKKCALKKRNVCLITRKPRRNFSCEEVDTSHSVGRCEQTFLYDSMIQHVTQCGLL